MGRAKQIVEADAVAPGASPLAAILTDCARGDAAAAQALRRWDDGRVAQLLTRTCGGSAQAQAALERLLADLASDAGAFGGGSEAAAEDWLFARMRLAARKAGGEVRVAPKLYAVTAGNPPSMPVAENGAASVASPPSQWHAEPTAYTGDDEAPGLAKTRLRRPNGAAQAPRITAVPAPDEDPAGRRGWLVTALLVILALLLGSGLAVLAVFWLAPGPPTQVVAPPAEVAGPPAEVAEPPTEAVALPAEVVELPAEAAVMRPPAAPPAQPAAPPADRLGPPLEAREPPLVAAPRDRPAPTPVPVEPAAVPSPRIVVHHGDDPDSRAVAEQLASQLLSAGFGAVAVKPVTFEVGTTSVRYFFDQDRARADRLTTAIGPFLSWHGRATPSMPIGFTDYRPLPRQGTLEIWLPRR